jgi:hypothetical protein
LVELSARNRTETKSEPSVPTADVGITAFQNGWPAIGAAAECDLGAARKRRPAGPGGVVEPNLQPCRVTGEERDMLAEIGVEGVE